MHAASIVNSELMYLGHAATHQSVAWHGLERATYESNVHVKCICINRKIN